MDCTNDGSSFVTKKSATNGWKIDGSDLAIEVITYKVQMAEGREKNTHSQGNVSNLAAFVGESYERAADFGPLSTWCQVAEERYDAHYHLKCHYIAMVM